MDQGSEARARVLVACALILLACFGSAAAQTPDLVKGASWLAAQVDADGSLASESISMGTPLQAREEVALALSRVATASPKLLAAVASDSEANTEYFARRILAAASAGGQDPADLASLLASQNADGGWGLTSAYQSDALDTAFALQALAAAHASAAAGAAFSLLARAQLPDGGWGVADSSSIYVTATVLLAATSWPNDGSQTAIAASSWLLGARDGVGHYDDSFGNAVGLLALSTQPGQSAALFPLLAALGAAQGADGSWNEDPYVTAMALRATWLATSAPPAASAGDLTGSTLDAASGQPLGGVAITLAENAGISAVSGSDGGFHMGNVPAGTYTLQFAHSGYQPRSVSVSIAANRTLDTGRIALTATVTTASLSGVVRSDSGQLLQGALVSAGIQSALTDASGSYQIVGINPGAATIRVSLAGYNTVTATVSFQAAYSYLFSPTLYPTSVTPATTSLKGAVIDDSTTAPIAGARVTLNGSTQVTDGSGGFVFASVPPGSYLITIVGDGYEPASLSATLVAGVNDLGAIALSPAVVATTLHGRVLDQSALPIPGAQLAVGDSAVATSDGSGAYKLTGLSGTQFEVTVAAPGFIAQKFSVTLSAPGSYEQDFQLVAEQVSALTLGPLTVAPTSGGANTNMTVGATLVNGADTAFDGILLFEVHDASGTVIGSGPLTDAAGFSVGAIVLRPGEHLGVTGRWNTGQFAPGDYSFELRVVEPKSVTRATPLGTLITSQSAGFAITPTVHFSGSVTADPPVIQAGLGQAVRFTGVIRNDGNVPLPAQSLSLRVVEPETGTTGFIASANVDVMSRNALADIDFGSWIPNAGGDYRLTVTAADPLAGVVAGSLYVGDVAQTAFTVNPNTVLAGTRNVHGNIHVSGVDPATATITDPLAPLIRAAVQKAIDFNDPAAHAWITSNRCSSCHIGNQALLGGELTRKITTFNESDRNTILNNISTNQSPDGGIKEGDPYLRNSPGFLSFWGLLGYHNLAEFPAVVKRAADWVVNQQGADGGWVRDGSGGWFDDTLPLTMLNVSSLRRTDAFLRHNAIEDITTYSAQALITSMPVQARGFLMATSSGILYVTDATNGWVDAVRADSTVVMTWQDVRTATAIVERKNGDIWVCTQYGIYRLNPNGTSSFVASDVFYTLAAGPDGSLWGTKRGDITLYRIDDRGVGSPWLSNGPFREATRITVDADGSLYVTDYYAFKVYHVLPDKSISVAMEMVSGQSWWDTNGHPRSMLKDGDHWLLSTTNGIYRVSSAWEAQRITWSQAADMARLPDGTVVYVAPPWRGVNKLLSQQEDVTGSLPAYAAALARGATWLQNAAVSSKDNLHMAQKLWGLGEAYRFFQPDDPIRAAAIRDTMTALAAQLRANQAVDGGWPNVQGYPSDALVTAQVGIALDYLNPSASDPAIRKAVAWLLSQQQPDGSWSSADNIMGTNVSTTTMVAIWLPMILDRLGAIDARVSVTFPPANQASAFTPSPTTLSSDAAGNVHAEWTLTGVTSTGVDLGFDLSLRNLLPDEVRAAAAEAHITFDNSFTHQAINQPIAIPDVTATAPVALTVATDEPEYPSGSTALVTTSISNLDDVEVSGALVVDVFDAAGAHVGAVTRRSVTIPAGGRVPVTDAFAIGVIAAGPYTVKAALGSNDVTLARGETAFVVLPDNLARAATTALHTDKQTYNASDQVQILSRVQSETANVTLDQLSLVVTVHDSANAQQFTHTYAIAQLLPKQKIDLAVIEQLNGAPAGIYTVKQDLLAKDGALLDHVEAVYNVSSSSDTGFGLLGTIAASPKTLPVGGTVNLAATASNSGNAALADVPLTITIVDSASGAAVKQFTQSVSLAIGATVPLSTSWITQGGADQNYVAVLAATVGSGSMARTITLAVDSFQLLQHLDATVTLKAVKPPLAALVLVDADLDPLQGAHVGEALAANGYAATFVDSAADFAAGVRNGAYRLYVLLGAQAIPDATTLRLLREAVHRGDGLLWSTGAPALPDAIAQAAGLAAADALPAVGAQSMDVTASAPGGVARLQFEPPLPARVVEPRIAQTQATLTGRLAAAPDAGSLSAEVARLGSLEIGYYGSDGGVHESRLSLASLGRVRNADGSDEYTAWRIRNSGDVTREVALASVSGAWVRTLSVSAHADAFVTSPVVSGSADHRLLEHTQTIDTLPALSSTFVDARWVDVGANPGAIALWANEVGSEALDWTGAQHAVHGAVHSNGTIRLSGTQNVIDGPVHYVTRFTNTGSQNTFAFAPRPTDAQPLPTLVNVDDFAPGGSLAAALGTSYFDASAECARSNHGWQRNASQMPLASGVYWIPCDAHISGGNGTTSTVTIVGTGAMQIDGAKAAFRPYYEGLQFATTSTSAAAIQLAGDATQVGGVVFAPNGTVQISGSSLSLSCSVIGNVIRFANAKTTIDARQCAQATVLRRSPAVLLNAFGEGWSAYAAFNWTHALSRYDAAGTGKLASLLAGVSAEVAPVSDPLRAGRLVPLSVTVQNIGDAFRGTLGLAANDDSLFQPAAGWSVDFTTQKAYSVQSNVRLGSGASTDVTATVAVVAPIALSPLTQSTATIAHKPGESVSDLVAAVATVSDPDVEMTAVLAALQAAKAAQDINDAAGELERLLDAAERCGSSTNAQAEDLRTRIDWVIWAVAQ